MAQETKIGPEQAELAYQQARLVREGQVTAAEARSTLAGAGFNANTASDLIANFAHMLDGKPYSRRLSFFVTHRYLEGIRQDYGHLAFKNALSALSKHIEYYEAQSGTGMPGLRNLLSEQSGETGESDRKLSDVNSAEAVVSAIGEFDELGRTQFLSKYGYGPSKSYFLEFEGKKYDSKAIIGVARQFTGKGLPPLKASEFSGGETTVKAKLESLGFKVVRSAINADWSDLEIREIIFDYLDMLKSELAGNAYDKTEHRARLALKLSARSNGSIEFKHSNISSALAEMGLPYIRGYKPRDHAQGAVATVLDELLEEDQALRADLAAITSTTEVPAFAEEVPPPDAVPYLQKGSRKRRPVRIDFQKREEQNRLLGLRGEELIVQIERNKLTRAGFPDLAAMVEHVAVTRGDGLGYDVRSFDEKTAQPLFIEVKTTTGNIDSPFLITLNEIEFSDEYEEQYALYRVFEFGRKTKFYTRRGAIRSNFGLTEKVYLASPIAKEIE